MAETLSFQKSLALLKKYGIPTAKSKVVKTEKEAINFAKKIGFPVAIKIDSPEIIHKTDFGAVAFNIKTEAVLKREYKRIMKKAKGKKVRGMLVQENVQGIETIIGGKVDPQFGEVVLFGLGGVFVEILEDVSVRVTPINKKDAMEMIKEIKGYPLLSGARGREKMNVNALANTILKINKLHTDHKEIVEIDLNPIFVTPNGVKAVDVRMIKNEKP